MVPDEGIEPPTFGLQNRCSTAELIRPSRKKTPWDAGFLFNSAIQGKETKGEQNVGNGPSGSTAPE